MKKGKRDLHHATLLVGGIEESEVYVRELLLDLGYDLSSNPDFLSIKIETLGIDESRNIKELALRKPFGDRKFFFIAPRNFTHEAESALLKLFEDPPQDTYFFLSVREEALLLPTTRSRMERVFVLKDSSNWISEAKSFLRSSLKDRIAYATKFAEEEKNLAEFLDGVLLVLRDDSEQKTNLKKVHHLKILAGDSIVTSRPLIEHLALIL